ncbi:MAG: hypothetical protein ACYC4L_03685 [Chloroflexota bacterium]
MDRLGDSRGRLAALEHERAELERRLPKHSVPMAMALRLEEIEEAIALLRRELEDD